ncbi:hypothetical protein [Microbispora sp. H11081]|uniref:hypothetical protein n=1 Tax=Microbispora sp. H11081 TaxID=2729107 RepID=UPI0014747D5B|nr:hypothetical protein [Microbispora sp. H11081]
MGEFVGVDPENLKELTKRLGQLHDLLARHSPLIQQKMQKWGSEVAVTSLPGLIAAALDDVRDMDARTTRAYELARQQGWSALSGAPGVLGLTLDRPPGVRLDWEATGQSAYQGERDAETLTAALAAKNPEDARIALLGLPESLRRHMADKDYQAAFWAGAGPLALRAARALYERAGGALFSAESLSVLRALGASLAAASQMRVGTGKDRRPLLPTATRATLTGNSDPWSVGMLVKYGPEGRSWDSRLLADLTRSMLDARAGGKDIWPPTRGTLETDADASRQQRLMAEYDAVGAVLQRAAENGMAARHVLGDEATGLKYARMLVSDSWHTPGYDPGPFLSSYAHPGGALPPTGQVDLSAPTAAFLKAAVSAERGTSVDAEESAWSVVHIVQATAEFSKLHPQTVLPKEIRQSLIYTADRYLPDLAASVNGYGNKARPHGDQPGAPWVSYVDSTALAEFLRQALHDPKDLGAFEGRMDARISASVAASVRDPNQDYLAQMSALNGLTARIKKDFNFDEAQRLDEKAQRFQTFLSIISGGWGALSFSKALGAGTASQVFVAVAQPPASELINTDHKIETYKINEDEFRARLLHVRIPVIQGLLIADLIDLPANTSWYQNGVISPNADFTDWYTTHERVVYGGRRLDEWVKDAEHAMDIQR